MSFTETGQVAGGAGPMRLEGIGVSPGVAVGRAFVYRPPAEGGAPAGMSEEAKAGDPAAEREQLRAALAAGAADLRTLAERVEREIGKEEAGIFEAQALMLEDPTIGERAEELIEQEGASAERALLKAAEEQAAELAALPDALWQARAADVLDAARQALTHLQAGPVQNLGQRLKAVAHPVVIVAEDLAPSDTVQMGTEQALAIMLVRGSATSHAAILSRARGIPAVVGVGVGAFTEIRDGDEVIVDGGAGVVYVRPEAKQLAQARTEAERHRSDAAARDIRQAALREHPGQTRDGKRVPLLANIGGEEDARLAAEVGAEGVGLLRTEFLFSGRATLPDEHEQAEMYSAIVTALGPTSGPIIVRTLDAGADKPLPALAPYTADLPGEANPALGVRGIRLQLARKALLRAQLRGLLRAGARTQAPLWIMLPMVATVEEVREARELLQAEQQALASEGVQLDRLLPLGIMVETPAAVFAAEALANEAEFFSIGTNDLTQYVMAADRLNPALGALNSPTQPAVLRAIAQITEAARRAGRHVGVCGEMAGDPQMAALLVGLGVDELSMNPASIPAVKEALARHTYEELRSVAEQTLLATTLAGVRQVLDVALAT
ncbi:MAG TPA: phosphoenolpyruvate--protein phosphotransferase [Ktedonobacterales bacterium]